MQRIVLVATRRQFSTGTRKIDKILIANRGEIAVRVARTARRMGKKVVAVFSDADANAMHVQVADEAYRIGPAPSSESYLKGDIILEVAKRAGAQAIHPGYGFLSENAGFADACEKNGVIFIGPPSSAIRAMGDKKESKILMEKANVPVVPGYHGGNQDPAFLKDQAAKIGFPLLIKATMGGGGKGMRIVNNLGEFDERLAQAKREAMSSFGDETVLLERYVLNPRHIEVQVFGDQHGGAVHLFERDCSVQRRHQKVLEESPAPGVDWGFRNAIGKAAVEAAKAVGYVGAGTVEFVVSGTDLSFFFMEMNTRLQVEHPVTESVTGLDLVEWQLRVAAGERLPLSQEQLQLKGHAIETRIYAESPENNFFPGSGAIYRLSVPAGEGVRVDSGVREGDAVGVFYDPMIAKLIVTANDRQTALRRMSSALSEYLIAGLPTNVNFLKTVVDHPAFQAGGVNTGFIQQYHKELLPPRPTGLTSSVILAAVGHVLTQNETHSSKQGKSRDPYSPWTAFPGFRVNLTGSRHMQFSDNDGLDVTVTTKMDGSLTISAGGQSREVKATLSNGKLRARIGDAEFFAEYFENDRALYVWEGGKLYTHHIVPEDVDADASAVFDGALTAPMAGKITRILVATGEAVKKGQAIVLMEAMKMEHTLSAPSDGVVEGIFGKVGEVVEDGKKLAVIVSHEPHA